MPAVTLMTNGSSDTDQTADYQSAAVNITTAMKDDLFVAFVYTRQAVSSNEQIQASLWDTAGTGQHGMARSVAQQDTGNGAASLAVILMTPTVADATAKLRIWGGGFLTFNTQRTCCHWALMRVSGAEPYSPSPGAINPGRYVQTKQVNTTTSVTTSGFTFDNTVAKRGCTLEAGGIVLNDATMAASNTQLCRTSTATTVATFCVGRAVPGTQSPSWTWTTATNTFLGVGIEIGGAMYPFAVMS